jgi:NADPH:quinone reductase
MTTSRTTVVVATAFGGPEVLELREVDVAEPGPGEVQVALRAIGTNPVDYKQYGAGFGRRDPAQLPLRLGREGAGVVTAVGEGAGPVRVGDEVMLYPASGIYAGALVLPAASVVPKPANASFEEAAGLLLAGATAIHALTAAQVGPGDTVLIHAAAGGVGSMAVPLAVLRGARVIGTASEAGHDLVRMLGAEPVAYGDGLARRIRALAPDGVDVAIDAAGSGEALDVSLELVSDRARIVTLVPGPRAFEAGVKVIGGAPGADPGTDIRAAARLELARLVSEGRLRVLVAATYPLADVAEAHRELARGHTHGKIVLLP